MVGFQLPFRPEPPTPLDGLLAPRGVSAWSGSELPPGDEADEFSWRCCSEAEPEETLV